MKTWAAETSLDGRPEEVLDLLTDPRMIGSWSPLPFTVVDIDRDRLEAGARARVRGSLAGCGVIFAVRIREADAQRFLVASEPVEIEATYLISPTGEPAPTAVCS